MHPLRTLLLSAVLFTPMSTRVAAQSARPGPTPLVYEEPNPPFAGSIDQVVLDRDGALVVSSRQDVFLYLFDASGRFLRTIGGSGEGPGEHRSIWRIGVSDTSIWTADEQLNRVSRFDRTGTVISTEPGVRRSDELGEATLISLLPTGEVLTATRERDVLDRAPEIVSIVVSNPSEGTKRHLVDLDWSSRQISVEFDGLPARWQGRNPFGFSDMVTFCGRSASTVVIRRRDRGSDATGSLTVEYYSDSGLRNKWQAEYDRRRVERRHLDTWLTSLEELTVLAEAGVIASEADGRRQILESLNVPDFLPPIRNQGKGILEHGLLCDDEDRLWIQEWGGARDVGDLWSVYDPQGVRLGSASLGGRVVASDGDFVWAVEEGQHGVETLVRRSLESVLPR